MSIGAQVRSTAGILSSDAGVKEKVNALDELRVLAKSPLLDHTTAKDVLRLLNVLYDHVQQEKVAYERARTETTRSVHAGRLAKWSLTVRECIINVCNKGMRFKSVKRFVYHMLDTLPTYGEVLLLPVVMNYLKTLHHLLSEPSHLDHLEHSTWTDLVTFCSRSIESYECLDNSCRDEDAVNRPVSGNVVRMEVVILWANLDHLYSWYGARLKTPYGDFGVTFLEKGATLVNDFLSNHIRESSAHLSCLSMLTNILLHAAVNDIRTARKLASCAVVCANKHWSTRVPQLKVQLLFSLMLSVSFWTDLERESSEFLQQLEDLHAVLQKECLVRIRKGELSLDHFDLQLSVTETQARFTLDLPCLKPRNVRSDRDRLDFSLLALQVYAYLDIKLSAPHITSEQVNEEPGSSQIRKKRKVCEVDESWLRDLSDRGEILLKLQLLLLSTRLDAAKTFPEETMRELVSLLHTDDTSVLQWSTLCVAAFVQRKDAFNDNLIDLISLWTLCVRKMTSSINCRASCFLMKAILDSEISIISVSETIHTVLETFESLGPAIICMESIDMVIQLFDKLSTSNYYAGCFLRQKALAWLNTHWQDQHVARSSDNIQQQLTKLCLFCANIPFVGDVVDPIDLTGFWSSVLDQMAIIESIQNLDLPPPNEDLVFETQTVQHDNTVMPDKQLAQGVVAFYRANLNGSIPAPEDVQDKVSLDQTLTQNDTLLMVFSMLQTFWIFDADCSIQSCLDTETVAEIAGKIESLQVFLLNSSLSENVLNRMDAQVCSVVHFVNDHSSDARIPGPGFNKILQAVMLLCCNVSDQLFSSVQQTKKQICAMDGEHDGFSRLRDAANDVGTETRDVQGLYVYSRLHLSLLVDGLGKRAPLESFAATLCNLPPGQFLEVCKLALKSLPSGQSDENYMVRDVKLYIIDHLISEYTVERSESCICFVIQFLMTTVKIWVKDIVNDLTYTKIYEWLNNICRENMLSSGRIRSCLVSLYEQIIKINLRHGQTEVYTSSTRSRLVTCLADEDLAVGYRATRAVMCFFPQVQESDHMSIYNDLLQQTVDFGSGKEGLLLRAHILSSLAVSVPYCRFQALFNLVSATHLTRPLLLMFKTIEMAESDFMINVVTHLIENVCNAIQCSTNSLFRPYMSRFIFAWAQNHGLQSLPSFLFGIPDMHEFYSIYYRELIGIMVSLGQSQDLKRFFDIYSRSASISDHLSVSYSHILAYGQITNLSLHLENSAEAFLVKHFITTGITQGSHYEILVVMFDCLHSDFDAGKYLHQAGWHACSTNYSKFLFLPERKFTSPVHLPQCTFPTFLEVLQNQGFSISADDSVLTSYQVVGVARSLFHQMDSVGKQHVSFLLGKFRVLFALAGRVVFANYPLKMILTGLLSLTTQFRANDDLLLLIIFIVENSLNALQNERQLLLQSIVYFCSECYEHQIAPRHERYRIVMKWLSNFLLFREHEQLRHFKVFEFLAIFTRLPLQEQLCCELLTVVNADFKDVSCEHNISLYILRRIAANQDPAKLWSREFLLSLSESSLLDCKYSPDISKFLGRIFGQMFFAQITPRAVSQRQNSGLYPSLGVKRKITEEIVRLLFLQDLSLSATAEICLEDIKAVEIEHNVESYIGNLCCHFVDSNDYVRRCKKIAWKQNQLIRNASNGWAFEFLNSILLRLHHDKFFAQLEPLLHQCLAFLKFSVPILVQAAICSSAPDHDSAITEISSRINKVLCSCQEYSRHDVELIMQIIVHVRRITQENSEASQANGCLEIDYYKAAETAVCYKFWSFALWFLHIAWARLPDRHEIRATYPELQKRIYENIDEPDSFYGVSIQPSLSSALTKLEFERDGLKLLPFYGALFESDCQLQGVVSQGRRGRILNALDNLGLSALVAANSNIRVDMNEKAYRSAWRLQQWNLPFTDASEGYDHVLYKSFCDRARETENLCVLTRTTSPPFPDAIKIFQAHGTTSTLEYFAIMGELEESSLISVTDLRQRWSNRLKDFEKLEKYYDYQPLLHGRQSSLSLLCQTNPSDLALVEMQVNNQLALSRIAIKAGDFQSALTSCFVSSKLVDLDSDFFSRRVKAELSSITSTVLWLLGDMVTSIKFLETYIDQCRSSGGIDFAEAASNLLDLGLRMSTARMEKPNKILKDYLSPAMAVLDKTRDAAVSTMHFQFASFCSMQFDNLTKSDDFRRLSQLRNEKTFEVNSLDALMKKATKADEKKRLLLARTKAKALLDSDESEYFALTSSKDEYLARSIESHLIALACGSSSDHAVSRCVTLWLANSSSDVASVAFKTHFKHVPSFKFLLLLNQFIARLNMDENGFQEMLKSIVERLCVDHPFHALYSTYAVEHSERKGDVDARDRQRAITEIMRKLADHSVIGPCVENIRSLCNAYVKLAQTSMTKAELGSSHLQFSIYKDYKVFKNTLPQLRLPPLTLSIEPRLSCDYKDVARIARFSTSFDIMSGISAPKVIGVTTSHGQTLKELIKGGNDDLRQDMVMQQVFHQVHQLLNTQSETLKRKLKIRTYKVIPLTTNSGVLEWVSHTIPLQAHEKYYPKDWKYSQCRRVIADVAKKNKEKRVQAYKLVEDHCHPVMRHCFLDMSSSADIWYERQLAYTRSSAAISVLGHVLGLGDRHLHNILIDKESGDVVHIDFGIAFEQGRTLPIPETVPFRLTRDLVDGMGILGVEGVFRRCCEFTLEILRREQDSISSILGVLKHDPLYSWTLSPIRRLTMQNRQSDTSSRGYAGIEISTEVGGEAARALLIVEQKLSCTLSTQAVISELIQEAKDPRNLALIFAGWSAYY